MTADETPDINVSAPPDVNKRRLHTLMTVGIFLHILVYPFLSRLLIPTGLDITSRLFYSRIIIWMTLGIQILYAKYGETQGFFLWPEKNYKIWFYLKAIVVVYLLSFAAQIVAHMPSRLGYHENNAVVTEILNAMCKFPFLIFFSAITAGITEEFIFRGYILSRLSYFFKNKHIAVILSALMFAFIHLAYKTVNELLFAFLIGLIYGYFYQRYRNITVLVIVHFLVDTVAFLVYIPHK